jgi:hypothetical protein
MFEGSPEFDSRLRRFGLGCSMQRIQVALVKPLQTGILLYFSIATSPCLQKYSYNSLYTTLYGEVGGRQCLFSSRSEIEDTVSDCMNSGMI